MSNNPESPLVSILEDLHLEPLVAADFEAADMARLAAAHPRRLAGIYSPRVRPAREEAMRQAFHRGLEDSFKAGVLLFNGFPAGEPPADLEPFIPGTFPADNFDSPPVRREPNIDEPTVPMGDTGFAAFWPRFEGNNLREPLPLNHPLPADIFSVDIYGPPYHWSRSAIMVMPGVCGYPGIEWRAGCTAGLQIFNGYNCPPTIDITARYQGSDIIFFKCLVRFPTFEPLYLESPERPREEFVRWQNKPKVDEVFFQAIKAVLFDCFDHGLITRLYALGDRPWPRNDHHMAFLNFFDHPDYEVHPLYV